MSTVNLAECFRPELFIGDLKSADKGAALDELSQLFVSANLIKNKEFVLEMLQHRENVGSTGIGRGIAIPHGRSTAASELMIAFGKSTKGMDWQSMDDEPVHLIFVVIAPPHESNNKYLPTLGRMVEYLSDKKNRAKLMEIDSYEDFIEIFQE